MSLCNIDHTLEAVQKKLADQSSFLSSTLAGKCTSYLTSNISQDRLNELFHLLKKYDLASEDEKEERNKKIHTLIENNSR